MTATSPLSLEDIQEAQEISDSPEANADPHFLLLGRPGVGKSTFAGKITGGKIKGSSGPTGGTRICESPGQLRYIKTELIQEGEGNAWQRYYVHDTVGLGDIKVDPEKMKCEVNEVCEQDDSCCLFLCLSLEERISSQDTHTTFEVCNSLNKWEDVIFVITKCDQSESIVDDNFKSQWKEAIKEKLISMGVNEEVADDITTKQILFSGHPYPQLRSELMDAIRNIIAKGLNQHKMKYLSLGKALFILETKLKATEEEELQRQLSHEGNDSVTRTNDDYIEGLDPVKSATESKDFGIRDGELSQHSNAPSSPLSPFLSSFSCTPSPFSPPSPYLSKENSPSPFSPLTSRLLSRSTHSRSPTPINIANSTSPPSNPNALSVIDVVSQIAKYIVGVTAFGIGGIVFVGSTQASVAMDSAYAVTASVVNSGTTLSIVLSTGAIITITLGALSILYFTGKLLKK